MAQYLRTALILGYFPFGLIQIDALHYKFHLEQFWIEEYEIQFPLALPCKWMTA